MCLPKRQIRGVQVAIFSPNATFNEVPHHQTNRGMICVLKRNDTLGDFTEAEAGARGDEGRDEMPVAPWELAAK